MTPKEILEELKTFLKNAKLSTYEIKIYVTLLSSNNLTARELCKASRVPIGRIYDVLEELKDKEIIEIQESRPKIIRALPPDLAFNNLLSYLSREKQKRIDVLFNQAKIVETKLHLSNFIVKENEARTFWSTAFGTPSVLTLYIKKINELQEELLITGFLNEGTLKILPRAQKFYASIYNALQRGVAVKYLWSFECDDRPLFEEDSGRHLKLFNELRRKLTELFDLSPQTGAFETQFIHKRIPTYYDIFDKKRVLMKFQNPINSSQIFAGINIFDPNLAEELRRKFLALWIFEAMEPTI